MSMEPVEGGSDNTECDLLLKVLVITGMRDVSILSVNISNCDLLFPLTEYWLNQVSLKFQLPTAAKIYFAFLIEES